MIQIVPVRPEVLGKKNYQKTDLEDVFISREDQTIYLLDGDNGIEVEIEPKTLKENN